MTPAGPDRRLPHLAHRASPSCGHATPPPDTDPDDPGALVHSSGRRSRPGWLIGVLLLALLLLALAVAGLAWQLH